MPKEVAISIQVIPWPLHQIVNDIIYVIAVCLIVCNELSKKYLKISLRQGWLLFEKLLKIGMGIFWISILVYSALTAKY